jgi:uncharacterized protein
MKHGVNFEAACQVFFDPFVRVLDASEDEEAGEAAIGLTEDCSLLFVVHTAGRGHHSHRLRASRDSEGTGIV